jgi:hypothetical protein
MLKAQPRGPVACGKHELGAFHSDDIGRLNDVVQTIAKKGEGKAILCGFAPATCTSSRFCPNGNDGNIFLSVKENAPTSRTSPGPAHAFETVWLPGMSVSTIPDSGYASTIAATLTSDVAFQIYGRMGGLRISSRCACSYNSVNSFA